MVEDKQCPMRMNKASDNDWWCTREKCTWWHPRDHECAITRMSEFVNCFVRMEESK